MYYKFSHLKHLFPFFFVYQSVYFRTIFETVYLFRSDVRWQIAEQETQFRYFNLSFFFYSNFRGFASRVIVGHILHDRSWHSELVSVLEKCITFPLYSIAGEFINHFYLPSQKTRKWRKAGV